MKPIYLCLGSNLGDRAKNIANAIKLINNIENTKVIKHSKNIETQALECPEGTPDFFNAAIEIESSLSAEDLLEETKAIEIKLGRTTKNSFAPRTIDIDILFYGEGLILDENLTVPHPLAHERYFVLAPMLEIAPNFLHPVLGVSIKELFSDLWQ